MFPSFETAHEMLGRCLVGYGDIPGAEAEFTRRGTEPSDAGPHSDLGKIQGKQENYDAALAEYRLAEICTRFILAHADVGRVLAPRRISPLPIAELKRAEALSPSDSLIHQEYAEILQASGDNDLGIAELREAPALDSKNFQAKTNWERP